MNKKANSNFHMVVNLNISHYDLAQRTKEQKLKLISDCKEVLMDIRDNIKIMLKKNLKHLILISQILIQILKLAQ